MALPLKLRNYYDKVVTPVTGMAGQLTMMGGRHRAGGSQLTGTNVQHMVQACITMNRFLSRFLEHVSLCSTPSVKSGSKMLMFNDVWLPFASEENILNNNSLIFFHQTKPWIG